MKRNREYVILAVMIAAFVGTCYLPTVFEKPGRVGGAINESLQLTRWYARQHVLLCLVPAFIIAGGISVFVSSASVMRYLGAQASKRVAYAVASVSGSVLAVCSCTVLPLFAGIYKMGAGLGPATAFLYAGPAVNVLAIILTARVLGWELGAARAVGAIVFSIVIGLAMHVIFRKEEVAKAEARMAVPVPEADRPLWRTGALFAAMVGILVFANWARSGDVRAVFLCCPGGLETSSVEGQIISQDIESVTIVGVDGSEVRIPQDQFKSREDVDKNPAYEFIYRIRWVIVGVLMVAFLAMVVGWVTRGEAREWGSATWGFAKLILPLLLIGVLAAGLLLGRPGAEGLIPGRYVQMLVGERPDTFLQAAGWDGSAGESIVRAVWPVWTVLVASVLGALMYFATLTEVPILHGLMGAGMGKGPALSLLLAGPALSLPNMLVIRSVIGTKKTAVYVLLVIVMATISGLIYGAIFH